MITLILIGDPPEEIPAFLVSELPEILGRPVNLGESLSLPVEGYNPRRKQYLGENILAILNHQSHKGHLVGLVSADCYAQGLNFIFGQARPNGTEAFVALPRLRESFYGRKEKPILFQQRVLKEVVHELGHTFGLTHCPEPACVMHFSSTLQDTDAKGPGFCSSCQARL